MIHMRWSRLFTMSANLALCLAMALSFAPAGWAGQVTAEEAENELLYLPLTLKNRIPFIESTGVLDTSFDGDGWAMTNINGGAETSTALALQPDGKIVVAGLEYTALQENFILARYNADGSLDTSFSGDGSVVTDFTSTLDRAHAVAIQADGKIIAAGFSANSFALVRYNPDGSLDTSFSGDGKLVTAFAGNSMAYAIVVQTDGKIVAAGSVQNPDYTTTLALARYDSNGNLDTSFSFDGKQVTDISGNNIALGLQADGKIIAGGSIGGDFALARYASNGDIDSNFSGDGLLTVDFSGDDDAVRGVLLQPDGMIVAVGYAGNGTNPDFAAMRCSSNGSLDNSFSGDGKLVTDFADSEDYGYAASLQPDGKIIIAGSTNLFTRALARYNADGSLDDTFSGDGVLVSGIIGSGAYDGQVVALQSNGKIVVVGSAPDDTGDFALERYTSDGSLDDTFGAAGTLLSNVTGSYDYGYAMQLQPDGKIVVAGEAWRYLGFDFTLARFNPDGSLDTSFSGDGKVYTEFSTWSDSARAVALQTDGKIVVAGATGGYPSDFGLARYNPDGSLDTSFDGDGMLITNIGVDDKAYSVVIQPDGKIVVAGFAYLSSRDFTLARYNPDGSLDTTFDGDGLATLDIAGRDDYGRAVALQPDGKVVVAGYTYNGTNYDFALARFNPNGSLDPSFHTTGYTVIDLGGIEYFYTLAIQPDGKILAAGSKYIIGYDDSAVVRFNPDGSLDTGFGSNGMVLGYISSAYAIALQPYGKIVVAGYAYNISMDFGLLRLNPDGSLDTSFSGDGLLDNDFLGGADYGYAVALQPDGRILVAGYASNESDPDFAIVRYK